MVALTLFIQYTKMGKGHARHRAEPQDGYAAGIDADRIISLTFIIGCRWPPSAACSSPTTWGR